MPFRGLFPSGKLAVAVCSSFFAEPDFPYFLSSGFLPSASDDSTLSSFRELLLHACVIGSDEATSPWTLPHAPLQTWACGPSLA